VNAHPIRLQSGEERRFLDDGDEITPRVREFAQIGFGECCDIYAV
jgi:hypothetical protein